MILPTSEPALSSVEWETRVVGRFCLPSPSWCCRQHDDDGRWRYHELTLLLLAITSNWGKICSATYIPPGARAPSRDPQLYYWRPLEMAVVTSLEWDDVDDGCIFYFAGWSLSRHARAPPWAAGTRGWAQGHSVSAMTYNFWSTSLGFSDICWAILERSALSFCPVCGPCLFPYSVLKYCPENEKQEALMHPSNVWESYWRAL